jgi:hypothetical protein
MAQAQRFGLKIRTRLSYEELDNVLGQYCQAGYSISIGGLDDAGAMRKKIMLLSFEKVEDRDRLKTLFAARRRPASAMRAPGAAAPTLDDPDEPAAA